MLCLRSGKVANRRVGHWTAAPLRSADLEDNVGLRRLRVAGDAYHRVPHTRRRRLQVFVRREVHGPFLRIQSESTRPPILSLVPSTRCIVPTG